MHIIPKNVGDVRELKQYFILLRSENTKKDKVFAEIAEMMDFLGNFLYYGIFFIMII